MAAMEAENARLQEIDDAALKAHRELDSLKSRYDAFASRQRELNDSLMQLEQETNVMAENSAGGTAKAGTESATGTTPTGTGSYHPGLSTDTGFIWSGRRKGKSSC